MKIYKTYLLGALFSVFAASHALGQSIIGAWTIDDTTAEGSSVVVFFGNGSFYHIENAMASEAPHGFDGFERGTYTWDPITGAFTSVTVQDLNGDVGFSNLNGLSGVIATISGDTLTFGPGGEPVVFRRVRGASPIVGAWRQGNATTPNGSGVVIFLPNGVYFEAEDGDSSPTGDPSGHDGIEHGTYSWNPTSGLMTSSRAPAPYIDTNGEWGLSHTGTQLTFHVSADGLTLNGSTGPAESFSLARVGNVPSAPTTAEVVEYFNASLDHYFITWIAGEIAVLDAGITIKGWVRTGKTFRTYAVAHAGTTPVCRYYIPPGKGDSHFFGRGAVECDATGQKNPSFVLEDPQFMQMFMPNAGNCPTSTVPVYRVFSNRPDANHRYMTEKAVRDQMVATGWLAEGDGPDLVVMCAPV
jgi:hypothetical protein